MILNRLRILGSSPNASVYLPRLRPIRTQVTPVFIFSLGFLRSRSELVLFAAWTLRMLEAGIVRTVANILFDTPLSRAHLTAMFLVRRLQTEPMKLTVNTATPGEQHLSMCCHPQMDGICVST